MKKIYTNSIKSSVISAMLCLAIIFSSFSATAHRIETFTSTGCTVGSTVSINALVTFAGGATYYAWQFRDKSGVWQCFTANSTINGATFTVSGFASGPAANLGPTLTINNATAALDDVFVRLLMRDNATPCGAPAGTTWGGDDLALNETKYLRLHIYKSVGDCGGTTPGCIGNILNNATGYYGGFENRNYDAATDTYIDNNFVAGAGSTDYTIGTNVGNYNVTNHPYLANSIFPRNIAAHSGNFQMVVGGNALATKRAWFKSVNVVAGNTYLFSAWVTKLDASNPNIALRVGGTEISNSNLIFQTIGNWVQVSGYYTAAAGTTTVEIAIVDKSGAATNYSLDDICFRLMGSIGDKVWNDVNKNGLLDANELGIAGVTVSLYDANNELVASTITDALGNYKFSRLNSSTTGVAYTVGFSVPQGYKLTTQNVDNTGITGTANSDANATTGLTNTITLTSATPTVTYVDAAMFITSASKIGDRVWNDINKNGVQDATEPGIAGVTVSLFTSADVFVAGTITDNNGNYAFYDVPAGNYYIKITLPTGFVVTTKNTTSNGGNATNDSDFDATTLRSNTFTVAVNTINNDIDAGIYASTLRSSLGDRVWNDLNSDGLQTTGEPGVAGVTVQLYNNVNVLLQTAVTDVLGNYVFNNLAAGSYYIKVIAPTGFTLTTAKVGADDNIDSDINTTTGNTSAITLLAEQLRTNIDAGLRRTATGTTTIGDFVWNDLNKDGLQSANEPGYGGLTLYLYNSANTLIQTTTTNKNGFYSFTGLTVGTQYYITTSNLPAGYGFSTLKAGTDVNIDNDIDPSIGKTGLITATTAAINNIDFGVTQKASVFNTQGSIGNVVFEDVNSNGLQDANEPGITAVTVTLYKADGTTVVAATKTDALGNYQFTNLPAGIYVVSFSNLPSGYVITTQNVGTNKAIDSDPNTTTSKTNTFNLGAGEINNTIDAGLRNTNAGVSTIGNLVWNDVNGDGIYQTTESGIAGVSVYLYDDNKNLVDNTVTNANGNYLFTNVKAGAYIIGFNNLPAGFIATTQTTANNADNDSDPNTINFETGEIIIAASTNNNNYDFGIRSTTTATIGDFVWNDLNRNGVQDANEPGVAGVLVTLYNSANVAIASTVTDDNGIYKFVNVAYGTYTLGFTGLPGNTGFTTKNSTSGTANTDSDVDPTTARTSSFTLNASTPNKLDVDAGLVSLFASVGDYIWRDANANGIQDATERGYAGITVTLYNAANNAPITSAVSDGNGYYFINNIPVAPTGSSYYLQLSGLLSTNTVTSKFAPLVTGGAATVLSNDKNSDFTAGTNRTDNFTLLPNENNQNIDGGIVAPDPNLLAIKGLVLSAVLNNSTTNLKWYTEAEINVVRFEIERSIDGTHFEFVQNAAAVGNSNVRSNYTANNDLGAYKNAAVVYYRIKSVDANNQIVYSNIVVVRPNNASTVEVWPNPFVDRLNIKVQSTNNTQASLLIFDAKGSIVLKASFAVVIGDNFINYNQVNTLASGAYTIKLMKDNKQIFTTTLIKK
ncbi:SdrD B-like domain-containing protein [Ferruginibacter yonginensis]|uniref:SdrD B-like domain-containing protein n=1 Tax=Ferruginibacter yonginensis TaxID=1310416 RepID=A0ABV8QPD6_9BACT